MNLSKNSCATLWIVLFLSYIAMIDCVGITCYQCTITPKPGASAESSQICNNFDRSEHFRTYCPHSTLCMKKTIRHRLVNGTLVLTSVERGCAPQLNISRVYDYETKKWNTRQEVDTAAYKETCFMGENRGSPGGPPEYCFCSFHLCNGSIIHSVMDKFNFLMIALISIFFI